MDTIESQEITGENTNPSEAINLTSKSRKSPLAFGAGNFGVSILSETLNGYVYFYYVDLLGLALTSAALVRTIYTILDVIDDPLWGFLSDQTHTRWGRRLPWLLPSTLIFMLGFMLVFSVPDSFQVPSLLPLYMLTSMLIIEASATIVGINYSALYAELFRTLIERTRVAVLNQTGNVLGVFIGLVLSPLLYTMIGFSKMAGLYAIVGGTLFLVSLYFNRENPSRPERSRWSDIKPIILGIIADRTFWYYIAMMILTLFAGGMVTFSLPFYVKYSLHASPQTTSLLFGAALISSLAMMPAWTRLIKRWKLRRVFLLSAGVMGICMLVLGMYPDLRFAIPTAVIYGAAVQGINVINIVIRASLISRNISRTSKQNEGSYYGMMNCALRSGGLLQALAMLLAGLIFGYVSGQNPGPQPGLAFRYMISVFPVVALLLGALTSWRFFANFSPDAES
jgi:GPH family glycoside/pentoside/hexuronide:cation symporter